MPALATDSASSTTPRIDYAPPQPAWRRRDVKRAFVLILSLSITALAMWKFGPAAWNRVAVMNAQRRCLDVQMPAKLVVFTTDAREGTELRFKQDSEYFLDSSGPVCWYSPEWTKYIELVEPPGRRYAATLYLGTRYTSARAGRFVAITAYPDASAGASGLLVSATVISPGALLSPPRVLSGSRATFDFRQPLLPDSRVRYFAGQPDPADTSHFTIDYEVDGQQHVLDGYLRDDDTVTLEDRVTPPPPPSAASPPSPG
jgi:hypothetical protein